jgi:hypothetical protein
MDCLSKIWAAPRRKGRAIINDGIGVFRNRDIFNHPFVTVPAFDVLEQLIEGTTFRCFEDFRQGKRDPISKQLDSTFSQLNQLLALACPNLRTPLARMEPHALTNFIEVPYDVKVENPPDEHFKKSGLYYEARIRSLNPRVYLVLMGITKEKNYNQHAIKIIKSVNKKAIIFDSYHPLNWIWHKNKKIGKDLQLKVGQFIKALGL